jgi:hypothetical protein
VKKLESVSDKVLALLHTELDSILSHLFIICLNGLQSIIYLLWHYGLAELDTPIYY